MKVGFKLKNCNGWLVSLLKAVEAIWRWFGSASCWWALFWGILIWDTFFGDGVNESTFLLCILCVLFAYLTRICDFLNIIATASIEGLKQHKDISIGEVTIDKMTLPIKRTQAP